MIQRLEIKTNLMGNWKIQYFSIFTETEHKPEIGHNINLRFIFWNRLQGSSFTLGIGFSKCNLKITCYF